MNANIALIQTSNTFNVWLIATNNLANSVNELRNVNYYKDNGGMTIANGSLIINGLGTLLSVSGNGLVSGLMTMGSIQCLGAVTVQGNTTLFTNPNVLVQVANTLVASNLIANTGVQSVNVSVSNNVNVNNNVIAYANGNIQWNGRANGNVINAITANIQTLFVNTLDAFNLILDPTDTYVIQNGNATFNNITIQGNQVLVGNTINSTNTYILRANATNDGDAQLEVYRGPIVNCNAVLRFDHTNNYWSLTTNDASNIYASIITSGALVNTFTNTSNTLAASAYGLNVAYNAAISNATAIVANTGSFVAQRKGIDFLVSGSVLTVKVTANSTNTNLTDVAYGINVIDSYTSNLTNTVPTVNAVYAAYNSAINTASTIAIGNAKSIIANNGVFVAQRQGIDIVNGTNIKCNVSANASNTSLVDVTIGLAPNIAVPGYVTALNVQSNTQQVAYSNIGLVGTATYFLDCSQGTALDLTMVGNPTVYFQNCAPTGFISTVPVIVRQTSNGSNTISWANTIKWSDNTVPVLTTTPNYGDIFQFFTYNGGISWIGAQIAANIPNMNTY